MFERWNTTLVLRHAGLLGLAASILLSPRSSIAQAGETEFDYGEVGALLKESAEPKFKTGHELMQPLTDALAPYYELKDYLRENYGFNYVVEDGLIFQASPNANGEAHANNELNLIAQWDFLDLGVLGQSSLIGWYQFSNTVGGRTTSEFQEELGVLSPLNGGDTSPGNARDLLQNFSFQQVSPDDRFRFQIGKLTTRTFLNLNRYAVGDREDFFSPMIVNNPVVLYTARVGLGTFAQYTADSWYVTGMMRDASADPSSRFFDTSSLDDGDWEYAGEAALTPTFAGLGDGNYRATYHYTDSNDLGQPSDWDLSFSFDQDLGERFAGLFRLAFSDKGVRTFQKRAVVGMRWKRPFGFLYDKFGVAGWWGEPSDGDLNDEYGLETFYTLQLAPYLELSPDAQLVLNRAGKDSDTPVGVFGLRLRTLL